MAAGRPEMGAVELVEADALDGPPSDDAVPVGHVGTRRVGTRRIGFRRVGTRPVARPARARRRLRAAAVPAGAVLAVLLAAGGAVQDHREDARLRGLVGTPGIVAPLDGPVVELWRGRGWTGSELRDVGGRLVGVVSTPYQTVDVVALEPRSGSDVWRTAVAPATGKVLWTRCVVPGAPSPTVAADVHPVVVCVAVDDTTTTELTDLGSSTYVSAARLVTVDAVDGTLLRDVPAPPTSQVAAWGTDAVVAHVLRDGRARLARIDPRTGTERWSYTTPDAVPPDEFGQRRVGLQTAGEIVALHAGTTWLLGADGRVQGGGAQVAAPGVGTPVQLLAEGELVARPVAVPHGGWGTEVLDVATGSTWSAAGFAVRPRPDDGSLPDVVLLRPDASPVLVAHDRRTGSERWRLGLPSAVPLAVLDGRVVAVDGAVVRAVDGHTGAELWTSRLDRPVRGGVVSDGRLLLVSASAEGGGGLVTALGLDDGRRRWSTSTAHAPFLFAVDGRLFGWSARGLQALGPATAP